MPSLRRSARSTRKIQYSEAFSPSYPDGPPATEFERRVASLNSQSFHSEALATVDDILIYSFFGSKRRPNGYRAMTPACAFGQLKPSITKDQGLTIRHLYKQFVPKQGQGDKEALQNAAHAIFSQFPTLFSPDHLPIIEQ
jgi:hypothetical protein